MPLNTQNIGWWENGVIPVAIIDAFQRLGRGGYLVIYAFSIVG